MKLINDDFFVVEIDSRKICVKGIGKLFYQDGFPISFTIDVLKDEDIIPSPYHIADELLKIGWTPKAVINRINADIPDIEKYNVDLNLFCNSTYEEQREMIFNYLNITNFKQFFKQTFL